MGFERLEPSGQSCVYERPIRLWGLCILLGAGLALSAFGISPAIIDSLGALSENEFRFVQLLVTAAVAFAGFYLGTRFKYQFDLKLAQRAEDRERELLASELLAELRMLSQELISNAAYANTLKDGFGSLAEDEEELPPGVLPLNRLLTGPKHPIFDASVGRLGLLGTKVSAKVIEVFSVLDRLSATMVHFRGDDQDPTTYTLIEIFADQQRKMWQWLQPFLNDVDGELSSIAGVASETHELGES